MVRDRKAYLGTVSEWYALNFRNPDGIQMTLDGDLNWLLLVLIDLHVSIRDVTKSGAWN